MRAKVLGGCLLACVSLSAASADGTNFAAGYPGVACGGKPGAPVRPPAFKDDDEIKAYNASVDGFNTSIEKYVACVQAYVDNASRDVELIKARMREAVDQANK